MLHFSHALPNYPYMTATSLSIRLNAKTIMYFISITGLGVI